MLVIQVFIMKNGAFEGTEMVSGDRIEIGRDPASSLQLDDESCSRRHAVLFEHDGKLAVQDLGSANGTRINGEAIASARYVGPRDDVAIGAFTLKFKIMSGQARAAAPEPVAEPTRVHGAPQYSSTPAPIQVGQPNPDAANERTEIVSQPQHGRPGALPMSSAPERPITGPRPGLPDPGPTEHVPVASEADTTVSVHGHGRAPPPPPVSEPSVDPVPLAYAATRAQVQPMQARAQAPTAHPSIGALPTSSPDVTAPDAALPARVGREPPPPGYDDLAIPDDADVPAMSFSPRFLADELVDDDLEDPPWSLVQRLVRPANEKAKNPLIEIVHYRGEVVVDHSVLHEGETFRLGDSMTRAERRDRGIPKVIPLVRLKRGGVAEVFIRDGVSGRLLRAGQQQDLASAPGVSGQQAVPITDGELASLKVGNERIFVRFAGAPQLLWTREDAAEDLFARRLSGISIGSAVGLFALMAAVSWIYQYRNADSEVIALEDEGFAEVELKELKMEEPPPEPEKPEPIQAEEPTPQPDEPTKQQSVKADNKPAPEAPQPKPGVLDILNSIPKVQDTASSQNLEALTSNIKAVRVPGAAAGFKTSALVGKGPSSGVQIGGAAGGLSTSGINSVLRKDGAAGAMGGKGDRAVSGKVVALNRQFKREGQGELSKEEIMRVINANIGQIQYCYEKALRTQPGLSGRVVLEWTVNTSGKVTVVKVAQSSLSSNDATRCMMDKLRTWKFPQPKGGNVTIVFPFVFNTV